jgi:transcriptional regulator NrdR family protein
MSLCPYCESVGAESDSTVVESRLLVNGWVRRRRRCRVNDAEHRWSTYEIRAIDLDLSEHYRADLQERGRA